MAPCKNKHVGAPWVGIGIVGSVTSNVEQRFVDVGSRGNQEKFEELQRIISESQGEDGRIPKTLVFANRRDDVERLTSDLCRSGVRATYLMGQITQQQRDNAIRTFKAGSVRVLVATDVAARGLDIPNLDHVINYELPKKAQGEDYVHRIGRTGRIGNNGIATSFVGQREPIIPAVIEGLRQAGQSDSVPEWMTNRW